MSDRCGGDRILTSANPFDPDDVEACPGCPDCELVPSPPRSGEAERDDYARLLLLARGDRNRARERAEAAEARVKQLEEALRFYADDKWFDGGGVARSALDAEEEGR